MQKSKLISLLRSFNKEEIRKFNEMVNSPFFNKEKVLMKFTGLICSYYPEFNSRYLEKEKVFDYLYPGKKYNDALMRNIISDLYKLSEEFLLIENLKADDTKRDLMLLQELRIRKLYKHFLQIKTKAEKRIEQFEIKGELYFDSKSELNRLYTAFLRETKDTYIRENDHYQESSDLVTAGFLIKILYFNTYLINRESLISNASFRLNFANEIDIFLNGPGKRFLDIPNVKSNYLSFKLLQTGKEEYFYKLKDFYELNFRIISKLDRKNIQTVLENYSYAKVTEGKVEFVKEQFHLYKRSVEKGTHKGVSDFISNIFFISIAATGFEAGESVWVEKFIREKINEVHFSQRDDTFHFCNALNSYWKGEYENSLVELSKVVSEEFAFKHNIKSLTLKIYYDLNESESFYSHVDAYKHFILNNKIVHEKVRQQVNNFVNYTKRLFNLRNSTDCDNTFELHKLTREISENHALINKIWLLKKTQEFADQRK